MDGTGIRSLLPMAAGLLTALFVMPADQAFAQGNAPILEGPGHQSPNPGGGGGVTEVPAIEERAKPKVEEKKKQVTPKAKPRQRRVACSADSLPAAERRKMEAEGRRIYRTRGKAAALAYARAQGMAYRKRLEAQGICPKR